ncbi:MAG: hypothetical protein ACXVBE_11740, partial [Bdellovibrionota bacterium]
MGKFGHRKYFSAIKSGALPLALFFALLPSAFASHISDCDANFAKISQLALERPSAESWDKTVGAAWETALRELQIPQAGVVIEVAPGDRAKVGIGLAGIDFHGTLYVVEPSGPALQRVVEKYKEILPNAKIIPVEKTLQDALPSLPKNADALLANHPIDDMILADRLDSLVSGKIFDNVRAAFENVEKAWQAIALDKKGLAAAQENTTNLWLHAVDTLKPRGLGISQYESGVLQKYKVFTPDQAAQAVVQKLKSHFGENDPLLSDRLARHRMQPERWIVAQLKKNNSGIPEVVNRMGPKLFVTADAEPLEKPFASPLFAQEPNSHPEKFALRITNNPKGKTVKVYVDRQVDPLRIAMNGNEGSGRAAYIRIDGTDINLKGLGRTPLAVSKDKDHSDGALDLPNAIWELLGSNLVHSNFRTSASPVVALFDRGD